jgi:hypothetical protein
MRVAFPAADWSELLKVLPAARIKGQVCLSDDYFRGDPRSPSHSAPANSA